VSKQTEDVKFEYDDRSGERHVLGVGPLMPKTYEVGAAVALKGTFNYTKRE